MFLDSNNDGTFDPREGHEFPRTGDLHVRIPIASNIFSEYPITIRYRWELFKPPGDPQRRMLLESPMVSIGGTVTVAGRPFRVEYPVSPGLWPEVAHGWFRIDAGTDSSPDNHRKWVFADEQSTVSMILTAKGREDQNGGRITTS